MSLACVPKLRVWKIRKWSVKVGSSNVNWDKSSPATTTCESTLLTLTATTQYGTFALEFI